MMWLALVSGLTGLLIGVVVGKFSRRGRRRTTQSTADVEVLSADDGSLLREVMAAARSAGHPLAGAMVAGALVDRRRIRRSMLKRREPTGSDIDD